MTSLASCKLGPTPDHQHITYLTSTKHNKRSPKAVFLVWLFACYSPKWLFCILGEFISDYMGSPVVNMSVLCEELRSGLYNLEECINIC